MVGGEERRFPRPPRAVSRKGRPRKHGTAKAANHHHQSPAQSPQPPPTLHPPRMKIENVLTMQLSTRSLGIWPRAASQLPGADASLVARALHVEHELARHLHNNDISPFEPLQRRSDSVDEILASTLQFADEASPESLELLLANVNAGHIMLLNGDFDAAQKLLSTYVAIPAGSHIYSEAVVYKRLYLLSKVFNLKGNFAAEKEALISGMTSFSTIPTPSNVEASEWLNKIYARFAELTPSASVSDLSTVFKNENFILSYLNFTSSSSQNDIEALIHKRADVLLASVSFPRAEEQNNYELEEFVDLITQSPSVPPSKYVDIVERAIAKTYQSHIVLRAYIRCLLQGGNQQEIKAAIEVYSEYIKSYYEQNGHTYKDIISIVQIYNLLLSGFITDIKHGYQSLQALTSEDYEYWLEQRKVLKSYLDEFYATHGIEKIIDVDVAKILSGTSESSPLDFSSSLRKTISELWRTLGYVTLLLNHCSHSIYSSSHDDIELSIQDYKHSIYLSPGNDITILEYAKAIAGIRRVKEAYRVTKVILKTLSNTSLAYFEAWHLLALILSVEENKDEAYKVANFLVTEITEFLDSESYISPLHTSFKIAFIQVKMTQIAIIESLFGIEQALDSLPEVFELFRRLFSSDIATAQSATQPPAKHKKSLSLSRTQTLSKIKSSLSHKQQQQRASKQESSFNINPKAVVARRTLQEIWLLTATIYAKLSLYGDAEQALVEAESVGGPTADTHSVLALLSSQLRPKLALKEYESAFILDRGSLRAAIGFAALIVNNDFEGETDPGLFISKKDKFAAVARAKILLESASETLHGAFTTEVWWLLAQIYGHFNDSREKDALWKSVELEETRPVRPFDSVNTFSH